MSNFYEWINHRGERLNALPSITFFLSLRVYLVDIFEYAKS